MILAIEHCCNAVFAAITANGPTIFPSLRDLIADGKSGLLADPRPCSVGDEKYYAERDWLPISEAVIQDTYDVTFAQLS